MIWYFRFSVSTLRRHAVHKHAWKGMAFRNALGIRPSESFWNRHIIPEREIYPPPVESCYRVALTLRGPSTRVRDCRWRLDVSRCLRQTGARHRLRLFATPVWFFPFPSRGRESANALLPASIPLLHGEQLCEINYSPPALTLIHVARTARLPSPSPPLSHFYYPYYSSLSLLFSLCPFSSRLLFLFRAYRILFSREETRRRIGVLMNVDGI